MADSTAIAATDVQGVAKAMADQWQRMLGHSMDVVSKVERAYEVPRDGKGNLQRPPGMSDADWNLACDAMKPNKDVPIYLAAHVNRVLTAQKIAGDRGAAPTELAKLVIEIKQHPKRDYGVIDVTPKEE